MESIVDSLSSLGGACKMPLDYFNPSYSRTLNKRICRRFPRRTTTRVGCAMVTKKARKASSMRASCESETISPSGIELRPNKRRRYYHSQCHHSLFCQPVGVFPYIFPVWPVMSVKSKCQNSTISYHSGAVSLSRIRQSKGKVVFMILSSSLEI